MTKILTVENQSYDLDMVPEEIEDIRYCVLDYSNPKEADYIFVPLVFLESFNAPAAILQVGQYQVKVPLDWSLIVCDPMVGDPEVLPVTSLNDRGFKAFVFNPLTGFLPPNKQGLRLAISASATYRFLLPLSPFKVNFLHFGLVPCINPPKSAKGLRCPKFSTVPGTKPLKSPNAAPVILDINGIVPVGILFT